MKETAPRDDGVGRSPPRLDGEAKVTGRARYLDDLDFPGQLHGLTVRSDVAHGRIRSIVWDPAFDWTSIVRATADDIPGDNVVHLIEDDQPLLAKEVVRHREEPIALLACADRERLDEALAHVRVEIEPLEPILDPLRATHVFKMYRIEHEAAGLAEAFAAAHRVVEGTYRVGHQEQMYIEPQAVCAVPREDGGVTLYGSMQCPFYVHRALQRLFKLDDAQVSVVQTVTGGGFGGKEDYPSILAGHAALLARKAGKPVKMVYRREEDVVATTKRHPAVMKVRTAAAADGTLLGCELDIVMDGGAYVTLSPVVASRGVLHAGGAYRWPHARIDCKVVMTNTPPNGAFRGFGVPQTIFAIETHMEKVAAALGLDPLELRRKNALKVGDVLPTGQVLRESVSALEVLDAAAERSGWKAKRSRPRATTGPMRGIGISLALHGAGFTGSGEAKLKARAGVELTPTGVRVLSASTDIGQGTITIFAQLAAGALGIPVAGVTVADPDTARVPDSGPTVASRTAMVVGGTIAKAAQALGRILAGSVAEAAGVPPESVVCRDGTFESAGKKLASFEAAAKRWLSQRGPLLCVEQYAHPAWVSWDEEAYRGDAYPCYAWAANVVEVEVDPVTCEVSVLDVLSVADVGKALHPVLCAGQVEGGTVQALGYALLESHVFDRAGKMLNTRMQNYVIPTALDVPRLTTVLLENPYSAGPSGAKGVGELPMDGPAPAVAAAVFHATGKLIADLPISPERILAAMRMA